jgi:2'-5' RNA ligase
VTAPAADLVLGVVIDIPEPLTGQLRRYRRQIGDPQVDAIPAHVTLLPPTTAPPGDLPGIERHLSQVAARQAPFEVVLDGVDSFRPVSPVVYVRVGAGGDQLDALQLAVRRGPLDRDLDFPFHPHVTVAHKLDEAVLDRAMGLLSDYSGRFVVDSFLFFEQGTDGVWRARQRFGFGSG